MALPKTVTLAAFDTPELPAGFQGDWIVTPDDDPFPGQSIRSSLNNFREGEASEISFSFELEQRSRLHFHIAKRGYYYPVLEVYVDGSANSDLRIFRGTTDGSPCTLILDAGAHTLRFELRYEKYFSHNTAEGDYAAAYVYPIYAQPIEPEALGPLLLGQVGSRRLDNQPPAYFNARPLTARGTVQSVERDYINGGLGKIEGIVYDDDKRPVSREVVLLERRSLRHAKSTWSASDGTYRFDYLDERIEYMVMGLDWRGEYNAVIDDHVRTEPMQFPRFGR